MVLDAKAPLWNLPKEAKKALARCWPGVATGLLPVPNGERQHVDAACRNPVSTLLPGLANPKSQKSRRIKRQLGELQTPHNEVQRAGNSSSTSVVVKDGLALKKTYDAPVAWLVYPEQNSASVIARHYSSGETIHRVVWGSSGLALQTNSTLHTDLLSEDLQVSHFPADLHDRSEMPEEIPKETHRRSKDGIDSQPLYRRKVQYEYMMADPHDILFTRPCINDRFSCGRLVESTIEDLISGQVSLEDIPTITVVRRHDRLLTLDHRRLYAFRAALPIEAQVPVKILMSEWLATKYVAPNCKYYHAVRVEHETPGGGPNREQEDARLSHSTSKARLSHSASRRKLLTTAPSNLSAACITSTTSTKYSASKESSDTSAVDLLVDLDCEPW